MALFMMMILYLSASLQILALMDLFFANHVECMHVQVVLSIVGMTPKIQPAGESLDSKNSQRYPIFCD